MIAVLLGAGCGDVGRPVESALELRIRRIYDAAAWLGRVPVELAVAHYARAKLEGFVEDLELPGDLETRLLARVAAEDFVDELVPFLLFLRDAYDAPEGPSAETFDDHLRAHFAPGDGIPGMEHELFRFEPDPGDAETSPALPSLDSDVVRSLLRVYDVLYLRNRTGAQQVEERLACESRGGGEALLQATRLAEPSIRDLLGALRSQLGEQADLAAAVRGVLSDPDQLEAATAALIRFVDQTVCRNYRFFAARAFRTQQLQAWLQGELDTKGGGDLWAWLEHAQHERRHGVVIVVDGLQGQLVASLARGDADTPFVRAIAREQRDAGGPAPRARSLRSAGAQQTRFLERLASRGFHHDHYLPFFRRLAEGSRVHAFPVGVSTTPTISVRNIPIALTGAPVAGPGGTGLPNFHFVDRTFTKDGVRRGRAYYFYGSDAVSLIDLAQKAGMRSLFERLPHLGSLSCTAQYDERAQFGIDALLNLGVGERLRDFGDRLCAAELERRAEVERELQEIRGRLLELRGVLGRARPWYLFWQRLGDRQDRALAREWITEISRLEQGTLPELLVYYDPWPDHFAHFMGPFSDAILAPSGELNRLDYWLGRVRRAYARGGVLPRTVFGMAGDHGLAPVFHLLNPEIEVFDALRDEGVDFRVVKISSDEGEGPKLTNPFDPPTMKGIDVVVASTAGGNTMLDLFVDQADDFTRQPLAAELRALRPLAAPETRSIDLIDEIAGRLADSLDYLVVRETTCSPAGGTVRLVATRDGARVDAVIERRGDRLRYLPTGADLLDTDRTTPYEVLSDEDLASHDRLRARCMDVPADDPTTWCDEVSWRELTSFTPRPDAVVQLAHLYDSDLAGTINLFPKSGIGYNSGVPGRHAGESFHEKNAFVAVWGAPLARRGAVPARRSVVNGAMPMAIYRYLTGETPRRGQDGWGYDPLPDGIFPTASK